MYQGEKAERSDGLCVYRTDDGKKCAVGCLIPDNLYDSAFEQTSVAALMDRTLAKHFPEELIVELEEVGLDLLSMLQKMHDDMEPEDWYGAMRMLAWKEGLSIPRKPIK